MSARRRTIALAALLLTGAALAFPAEAEEAAKPEPHYEMATTQMAFLTQPRGAKPLGEREIQSIQERHLQYLRDLFAGGKVLIEGPIHGSAPMRSVIVLDVATKEEAEALLAKDPWISSGQRVAEIHGWWSAKGILRRPASPDTLALCYLGLLERPENAPSYPEEKLKEIQAGHMANISAMAASHDLVLAGPIEGDSPLRGILLFRTVDTNRIRELVTRDPAVAAGRLRLALYPWYVPEGTLPD